MKKFLKGKSSKADQSGDADRDALFGNRQPAQRRPSTESTASRQTILPPYQDPYADTSAAGQRPDPYLTKGNNSYGGPPAPQNAYTKESSEYMGSSASRRGAPMMQARQSTSTLAQREELFRGAQPDRRLEPSTYAGRNVDEDRYGMTGPEDDNQEQTQEEEDEDVEGIKQEIRFVKQESLSSTRNALRMAQEAEESGRSTLTKLGEQSESLANAEESMDLAKLANRDAQIKARELKHLNRSMFAIKVDKPWGKNKRIEADELRVRQQFADDRNDREAREAVRRESERRTDANLKAHAESLAKGTQRRRAGLAERSKYQFEADEEDDEVEREIDDNLDQIASVAGRLKGLAMATNSEVTKQNQQLERLDRKGEHVGEQIFMNTHRLKRISERG